MRVERTVDSTVKESLQPVGPAQSRISITLVFMLEERVLRTIGRIVDRFILRNMCEF